jgi:CBS domain-containing protein
LQLEAEFLRLVFRLSPGWLLRFDIFNPSNYNSTHQSYDPIGEKKGDVIMKPILVKEVYRLLGKASITVSENSMLDYLVAFLGHEPHIQGIFFLDSHKRFSGMLSRFDLLRLFRLYSQKPGKEIMAEFFAVARSKKAKDLELPDKRLFYVKENDTLQSALELMLDYEQNIIPVLDDEGTILGDLSLSEILSKALEADTNPQA